MEGLILTEQDLREQVIYFLQQSSFVFDVETMDGPIPGTRGIPTQNRVVWISLATYGRTIVIPMGHPNGDHILQRAYKKLDKETRKFINYPAIYSDPPVQMKPSIVFDILRPLFFHPKICKVAHNATFDVISIEKYYGEVIAEPIICTITQQWLLNENIGEAVGGPARPMNKKLKEIIRWYYRVDYDKEETGKCIELHPFSKVARYVALDANYTWVRYLELTERLESEKLESIWLLETATTTVCSYMGLAGATVDVEAIRELEGILTVKLEEIEARVYKAAKKIFNINSSKQKQELLYGFKKDGNQGLKPRRLTKGGAKKKKDGLPLTIFDYSTDKESLEDFPNNELVKVLLEYAEVDKILSTYVRSYLGDPDNPIDKPCLIFDGRIHTDLVQYGTVTGRFSSRAPNLQNIPRPGTELGTLVRGLFRAPEGYKLVVADYGQMELRILASYIGFGGLFDGFQAGIDAHTQTAALVFNVAIENVEKWMRDAAKTLNFAIVYGAGPDKVANMLGMTLEEAKELLANHRIAFPEIYAFKKTVINKAAKRAIPHIKTILGRVRRVWDLRGHSGDDLWKQWKAERQLFNSLIQGSLGDIIKLAMVRMYRLLSEDALKNPGKEIQMILSVHDELVILSPAERAEEASRMLKEAMLGAEIQDLLKVPMDIGEPKIVDRWSEAK
jgi:DNA polymerase I-like protein with 3'-5' exonuclease and polymerase domains